MTLLTKALQTFRDNLAIVAVAVIAALLGRLLYNRYERGLNKIPGPFLASLSDLWLFIHYMRRRGLTEYNLHQAYKSPILRLGPRTVSVADAEAIRVIYGWKPVFRKSRLYISQNVTTADGTILENVSSTRSEETHRDLRRPIAHAYALSTLVDYEPLVDRTSLCFMHELRQRFAQTGQECPMSRWLQMYAFDVIGELTFSKRFGFLESGKDLDNMMYHTGRAMDYIGIIGQVPTLDELVRIRFGHILRRLRPANAIMSFTVKQIQNHSGDAQRTHPDFLTRFIQAREKYPELITDRRLATYTNTNVSAGSDTTAIALREVVFRILSHPGSHQKIMEEVRSALLQRIKDGDDDKPITWAESQKMTYFQALIKECFRIHSGLGQLIPRDVPQGGVELCGQYIPEGTVVGCNAWTVHRDKNVFGQNADVFRPERWIDEDPARLRYMDNLNFAFGAGARVCLGKNIAMLEISKMVPELFRRFELRLVDPRRYKLIPGWLVLQTGLDVMLVERDSGSLLSES